MKKFVIFFASLFIILNINANGKDDKTKYRDTLVNVGDLRIQADDVFSTDAYVKAKFRFENKNDFFILLDPNKSFFYINGNKSMCKEREIVLPPGTKKTKVFDVKGPNLNSVQALSLVLDGFTKTGNEKMVNMPELVADRKQKTSAGGVEIAIDDVDSATVPAAMPTTSSSSASSLPFCRADAKPSPTDARAARALDVPASALLASTSTCTNKFLV